jgi:hypothetical protein
MYSVCNMYMCFVNEHLRLTIYSQQEYLICEATSLTRYIPSLYSQYNFTFNPSSNIFKSEIDVLIRSFYYTLLKCLQEIMKKLDSLNWWTWDFSRVWGNKID